MKFGKFSISLVGLVLLAAPTQLAFAENAHDNQTTNATSRASAGETPILSKSLSNDIDTPLLGSLPKIIRSSAGKGPIEGRKLSKSDIQAQEFLAAYQKHMEQLASSIAKLSNEYSATEENRLRESYEWLLLNEQSPQILAWVRKYFSNPNMYVRVSDSLLKKAAAGIEIMEPVDENTMEGSAQVHTTGMAALNFSPNILPSKEGVKLNVGITGNVLVDLAAQIGRSSVDQVGSVELRGNLPLTITETKIAAGEPTVSANATTATRQVESNRGPLTYGIAKAIVRFGTEQIRPETNAKLASQVENKLVSRIREEVTKMLPGPEQIAQALSRNPFNDFSEEHTTKLSSGLGEIKLEGSYTSNQHLMSPYVPNLPKFKGVDLTASVHQSAFNNNMTMLSGATISDSDFQTEVLDKIQDSAPKKNSSQKSSITFDEENPLQVTIHDGKISFELRSSAFTKRDTKFHSQGSVAKATYKLVPGPKGLDLVRDGEIQIEPGKANEETAKALKEVSTIFLSPNIHFGELSEGNMGSVLATQVKADNGWLNIGLKYTPSKNPKAALTLP